MVKIFKKIRKAKVAAGLAALLSNLPAQAGAQELPTLDAHVKEQPEIKYEAEHILFYPNKHLVEGFFKQLVDTRYVRFMYLHLEGKNLKEQPPIYVHNEAPFNPESLSTIVVTNRFFHDLIATALDSKLPYGELENLMRVGVEPYVSEAEDQSQGIYIKGRVLGGHNFQSFNPNIAKYIVISRGYVRAIKLARNLNASPNIRMPSLATLGNLTGLGEILIEKNPGFNSLNYYQKSMYLEQKKINEQILAQEGHRK